MVGIYLFFKNLTFLIVIVLNFRQKFNLQVIEDNL